MKYANIKWPHSFTAQTSKVAKILSNSQTYIRGWIRLLKLSLILLEPASCVYAMYELLS